METTLLESLSDLGYVVICVCRVVLMFYYCRHETTPEVIKAGIKEPRYREILIHLANEIHVLGQTEERITHDNDLDVLSIELSSLLSELNCPFTSLTTGSVADRFANERFRCRLCRHRYLHTWCGRLGYVEAFEDVRR